ncbi:MAG: hypothetical protein Q8S13_11305 [Dehalococcoidia bacterium]|nr:hypothetical protein [Dehalococcoidia bacterium]
MSLPAGVPAPRMSKRATWAAMIEHVVLWSDTLTIAEARRLAAVVEHIRVDEALLVPEEKPAC